MGTTPAPANPLNSGDIAWVLTSAALVLAMTAPGLALFYGGMVRRKNVNSMLMQCFMCLSIVSVLWVVIGYSLAFGPGAPGFLKPWVGGLDWFMLKNVSINTPDPYAPTIPNQAYMIFQCMFAVITPALAIGSFAERVKFSGWVWWTVLWLLVVYCPVAHMVWSHDGIEGQWGVLDFAGGTVVHMNAGIAGLASCLYLGKRLGTNKPGMHNVPFVMIGASLLWFGWFGFNAGSAVEAHDGLATSAFVVTNTATAAAAISWAAMEWIFAGAPTLVGACSGAVAGLVAITPASGFVDVGGSLWIGFLVSVFCYSMVAFVKPKFGYDDTLDAFGVHYTGGLWGALATGLFAVKAINSAGSGVFDGNAGQFLIQAKGCAVTTIYSFVMTLVICFIVDKVLGGFRASAEDEIIGIDLSQHHERAYTILD